MPIERAPFSCSLVVDHPSSVLSSALESARRLGIVGAGIVAKEGPLNSFCDLLAHLGTLTRQAVVIGGQQIDKITTATPAQRQALDLIGATIAFSLEQTSARAPRDDEPPAK